MTRYIQVQTTVTTEAEAVALATLAVEERLAGCVQITSCSSVYQWQGKIEHDREYLCTMKSHSLLFPLLRKALEQAHPYDVPEIIALPITDGADPYLQWLGETLRPLPEEQDS